MIFTSVLVASGAAYLFSKLLQPRETVAHVEATTDDTIDDDSNSTEVRRDESQPPDGINAEPLQPVPQDPRAEADAAQEKLIAGVLSMGLAAAGVLVAPPIGLVSLIPSLYITGPLWKDAYFSLIRDHEIRASVVDVAAVTIAGITGNFVAVSMGAGFFTLSRKLLAMTEDRSRATLVDVFDQRPAEVWIVQDGTEVLVPIEQLQVGDEVVVRAGHTVPIDGVVASGVATVDQHMFTGEEKPVDKGASDRVYASTTVISGSIRVIVEQTGKDTLVAQLTEILNRTAEFKSSVQARGERTANAAAAPFLVLSAVALPLMGLNSAGAILCSSFGYHLRILGPLGMLNFLTMASKEGILIKDGRSLEILDEIDTVVFDKTGTLTLPQPKVASIRAHGQFDADTVLQYAASAENRQTHPIARAIVQEAEDRGIALLTNDETRYDIGHGLDVRVGNSKVLVGSDRYMTMAGLEIPAELLENDAPQHTRVFIAIDGRVAGVVELHVALRPEAKEVVKKLAERGLDLVIISGDHELPTQRLAEELGIQKYHARVLPEKKAQLVEELQQQGKKVCFVGDGINDVIALKRANASISLSGATMAATDSAQVVLLQQNLEQLWQVFELSAKFNRNQRTTFAMTMAPSILGVGGAFFLNFGLVQPILLNNTTLAIGAANTMLPLIMKPDPSSSSAGKS